MPEDAIVADQVTNPPREDRAFEISNSEASTPSHRLIQERRQKTRHRLDRQRFNIQRLPHNLRLVWEHRQPSLQPEYLVIEIQHKPIPRVIIVPRHQRQMNSLPDRLPRPAPEVRVHPVNPRRALSAVALEMASGEAAHDLAERWVRGEDGSERHQELEDERGSPDWGATRQVGVDVESSEARPGAVWSADLKGSSLKWGLPWQNSTSATREVFKGPMASRKVWRAAGSWNLKRLQPYRMLAVSVLMALLARSSVADGMGDFQFSFLGQGRTPSCLRSTDLASRE